MFVTFFTVFHRFKQFHTFFDCEPTFFHWLTNFGEVWSSFSQYARASAKHHFMMQEEFPSRKLNKRVTCHLNRLFFYFHSLPFTFIHFLSLVNQLSSWWGAKFVFSARQSFCKASLPDVGTQRVSLTNIMQTNIVWFSHFPLLSFTCEPGLHFRNQKLCLWKFFQRHWV